MELAGPLRTLLGLAQWTLKGETVPDSLPATPKSCNTEDPGSIPGSGRSPGGGHGDPLQYSCLAHTPAACSFPGENATSWEALGEARPGQSSLSDGAHRELLVKVGSAPGARQGRGAPGF